MTTATATRLSEPVWRARRAAHEQRVDGWIEHHLHRRRSGVKHPVHDFLFTYYSHRPAQLRTWHPGAGVLLDGGEPARDYVPADGGTILDPGLPAKRTDSVRWIRDLLAATASRPPQFGCFGMHEWAMVYRQTQAEVRHNSWPLRLSPSATAEVVQDRGVRCTHFDAFRFFTAPARPLNVHQPTRESQQALEQPGCLHGNMDLYKWSYKLSPLVPSELVGDCFALSREIRELDMRASPYDLADLGFPPVLIETPEGRAQYAAEQRAFADRAAPLRAALITACDALLANTASVPDRGSPRPP
ncbi:3-methyladenine DNA glycosylase [Catellatospora sp. KI3]|uniref:3-methyladenine DNA glycosylase n=1 Tax=Catellatospora sp. KI3 TaxID=3041620 RepID=UPI00248308D1|nr:3-methyladenine DNA glycosylase [Catellatospora sp. KI3]MDI1459535.1 3-methyladenine DNA glycosylase [Catellatospora sp. KI3]